LRAEGRREGEKEGRREGENILTPWCKGMKKKTLEWNRRDWTIAAVLFVRWRGVCMARVAVCSPGHPKVLFLQGESESGMIVL